MYSYRIAMTVILERPTFYVYLPGKQGERSSYATGNNANTLEVIDIIMITNQNPLEIAAAVVNVILPASFFFKLR